jgi:hypothetical protein
MLRDPLIAAVRTGVATLVGLVIAYLVAQGVELDDTFKFNAITGLTILFTALYNFAVGLLERRVNPLFGVLLGVPKAPAYGSVGTKTPGGAEPAAVDQALDYVSPETPPVSAPPPARDEQGNTSVIGAGLVLLVVGVIVSVLTTAGSIGYVLIVVGAIVMVVGAVMMFAGGNRGNRVG